MEPAGGPKDVAEQRHTDGAFDDVMDRPKRALRGLYTKRTAQVVRGHNISTGVASDPLLLPSGSD